MVSCHSNDIYLQGNYNGQFTDSYSYTVAANSPGGVDTASVIGGPDPVAVRSSMQNYLLAPLKGLIPKVCGYGGFGYAWG